ncbi:MAG: hypothetical protein GXX92_11900 [Clostridiales bacterium]|nr:hypothetical protein [Clostridiales bacterium]
MNENRQTFQYEKAIMLSAIYDALDALDFNIDTANSSRGTLTVSSHTFPGLGGRIAVSPLLSENGTTVEVFTASGDETQSEWIFSFFNEVKALLEKAKLKEVRK